MHEPPGPAPGPAFPPCRYAWKLRRGAAGQFIFR
jgi:hypothetical protein